MQPSPTWRHQLNRHDGVSTLAFSGELDLACVPAMQSLLFEQVQAPEVTQVRVDLALTGLDEILISG
jgi:ABC-type transporter Mla MlaB component